MQLTEADRAVLAHVVKDPQEWIDNAVGSFGEDRAAELLRAKVARWRPDYAAALQAQGEAYRTAAQRRIIGPPPATVQGMKAAARGVIIARFPEWRQANMVARGVELQDLWRRNGQWTPDEQAEAGQLQASWDWIKAVRARSDELEAAIAAGQAVDVAAGAIDGEGAWPAA